MLTNLKKARFKTQLKFLRQYFQVLRMQLSNIPLNFMYPHLGTLCVSVLKVFNLSFKLIFTRSLHLFYCCIRLLSQIYLKLGCLLALSLYGQPVTVNFRITLLQRLILMVDVLLQLFEFTFGLNQGLVETLTALDCMFTLLLLGF